MEPRDILRRIDTQFAQFFGRERLHGAAPAAEDEVYMALLPHEFIPAETSFSVHQAADETAFADCAQVVNAVLSDGRPDLHPVHHAPLMKVGRIRCHVLYEEGKPVSAAVTMAKEGAVSLEFVATLPDFRRRGYSAAVCRQAVADALRQGAEIVTLRAVSPAVARLYARMGFRAYNHVL